MIKFYLSIALVCQANLLAASDTTDKIRTYPAYNFHSRFFNLIANEANSLHDKSKITEGVFKEVAFKLDRHKNELDLCSIAQILPVDESFTRALSILAQDNADIHRDGNIIKETQYQAIMKLLSAAIDISSVCDVISDPILWLDTRN